MKKLILLISSFCITSFCAQTTKRVLFIGNSYTYSNNMPELLKSISQSVGDDTYYDSNLIGGSTLQMHAANATTLSKIQQGNWDYVVLQDQSQIPSFSDSYVQNYVYPFAAQLDTTINTYNSCAETVFFMTWGRKNGDSDYCPTYPAVCTYEGMDDLLKQRYMYMANQNSGIVSPVGAVWRQIRTQYPQLNFYESDESHPNLLGSYAIALTFYTTIFRKNPELTTFIPNTVSSQDATAIKTVVKNIVYDQLAMWNIGQYDSSANFTVLQNPQNPLEFSFQNSSQHAETYTWNFGDGTQSSQMNPVHTYTNSGQYTVTLTAERCGTTSVKTFSIDTNALSVKDSKMANVFLYPNPGKDNVYIQSDKIVESLMISDSSGRILNIKNNGNIVNVTALESGVYYFKIKFKNDDLAYIIKFLKQ